MILFLCASCRVDFDVFTSRTSNFETTKSNAMTEPVWTTLITTPDYAQGLLCLAYSLLLVQSKANLLCYVPSETMRAAIVATAEKNSAWGYPNLIIEVLSGSLYDEIFNKDLSRDASMFIDAPRRFLFRQEQPFIFLDADMIATQNFDELLEYIQPQSNTCLNLDGITAVPNFRNKKKGYGDSSGNFNAGMMIVPKPSLADYNLMMEILEKGYNDTEEKLINEVFRNRWHALPVGFNCQKRAYKLAPTVWNDIHASTTGIRIIHYVGGKPWQSVEELLRLDYEAVSPEAMAPYQPIFDLWHDVYEGRIRTAEQLRDAIPLAIVK